MRKTDRGGLKRKRESERRDNEQANMIRLAHLSDLLDEVAEPVSWDLLGLLTVELSNIVSGGRTMTGIEKHEIERRLEQIEKIVERILHIVRHLEHPHITSFQIKEITMLPIAPGFSPVYTATPVPAGTFPAPGNLPVWTSSDTVNAPVTADVTGLVATVAIPATAVVGTVFTLTITYTNADGTVATGTLSQTIVAAPPADITIAQTV
jgi:hypothetical protein